jgi:hypothetical protein
LNSCAMQHSRCISDFFENGNGLVIASYLKSGSYKASAHETGMDELMVFITVKSAISRLKLLRVII